MAIETPSRYTYDLDGTTRVFFVPTTIKGEDYCRLEVDSTIINDRSKFDIVNNSIVFVDAADVPSGSQLDVLVVQSDESLGQLSITSNIDIVAQNIDNVNTVGDNTTNVNTVASSITNINDVADDIDNINTVGTNIASVNTTAGSIGNVNTTAGSISNVNTVSTNIASVNTTASNISNVNTVAGISGNVTTVAGNTTNINQVASDTVAINEIYNNRVEIYQADTNAATATAQAGIATTKASEASASASAASSSASAASSSASAASGSASTATTQASNASASASAASSSATSASNSANAASSSASSANSSASTATTKASEASASALSATNSLDSFNANYTSSTTEPTSPEEGALWFDETTDIMKVYNGSSWQSAGSSVNGTSERQTYTATSGQTVFNATYDSGFVDVYLNGIKLQDTVDFTATNGTTVVMSQGLSTGDIVDIVAYGTFELADVYTQAQTDSLLATKADANVTYTETEVNNLLDAKQNTLVSGSNIKTVNGNSLVGSGDLATVFTEKYESEWEATSNGLNQFLTHGLSGTPTMVMGLFRVANDDALPHIVVGALGSSGATGSVLDDVGFAMAISNTHIVYAIGESGLATDWGSGVNNNFPYDALSLHINLDGSDSDYIDTPKEVAGTSLNSGFVKILAYR